MGDFDFTVFHVGGKQGIGEVNRILRAGRNKPNKKELYVFEADLSNDQEVAENKANEKRYKRKYDVDAHYLGYCISDKIEGTEFYINRDRLSSSLFKIDSRSITYRWWYPLGNMWKDHCLVDEARKIETTTLDELRRIGVIGANLDCLSMDAQGSELSIMKGAKTFFDGDLLGVITEVEFREIYENQPLFADQDIFLRKNGFIFINILSRQDWFLGPGGGTGLFTVAEVLYLKDLHQKKF